MNRPVLIAAFALLFGTSLSLSAQHGGGAHAGGGGGHAAIGGGFGGHVGGAHSFSGARSGGFRGRSFAGRSSAFNRGSLNRFGRNRSGVGLRIRSYPYYGRNCWGGYCGYGYGWGYPYLWNGIDPYWWWDNGDNSSDSGYDQAGPYGYDNGLANQMQQQGIPMRPAPESDPGEQHYYGRSSSQPSPQQQASAAPGQPTVLVFRDQHQEEVQNYAIVGQTLWNFSSQHTQKIPLSELDIPATEKANQDRGVEFKLPSSSDGA
jgi:hypothetical protein